MADFKELVAKALDQLPRAMGEKMENVSVCIEPKPTKEQQKELGMRRGEFLLGLYEGVPQAEWGRGMGGALPDKITLFQEPLEQLAQSQDELVELVQETIHHEVKHHFGFTEEDLQEPGKLS